MLRTLGFLWIIHRHPRVPRGVAAYLNGVLKNYHAELVGSRVDCCKKVSVISVSGRRWSHKNFGKSGVMPDRIDKKCALKVLIDRSAVLRLWMSGGTS